MDVEVKARRNALFVKVKVTRGIVKSDMIEDCSSEKSKGSFIDVIDVILD